MSSYVLPALLAVFTWWAMTGVILYLDGRAPRTFPYSMAGATVVLGASFWGLGVTAGEATVRGACLAFLSSLGVWSWIEMSFLTGFVTGPRRRACPAGCGGGAHFGHAIGAILYHELAILAGAAAVLALTAGARNPFGAATFLLLWAMRTSAKLNLFLGVRNLGGQYLPAHLKYLQSYFRSAPMNLLFPFAVTAGTVLAAGWTARALAAPAGGFLATGYTLLATLLALAVLEHWFLVLPIPSEALWRFGLNAEPPPPAAASERRRAPHVRAPVDFAPEGQEHGAGAPATAWSARVEAGIAGDIIG